MTIKFTVSDLRQFEYCARVVYFTHCAGLGRRRPTTYKMQEGGLAHERVTSLEERRSLKSYGLEAGARRFEVRLISEKLGLTGLLDMLILNGDEAIPVEYKNSFNATLGMNHKLQLGAYALMVEEQWQLPVRRAFVHFIPVKVSREVSFNETLRRTTLKQLAALHQMVAREAMPDATKVRGRCTDCEFRNFCPDVR